MDLNINLSELRQILCKKIGPACWVVVGKFEKFSLSEKHTFCK
ncbi:hypothetical protein LEP1GSC166_0421 [Leptospira kirschneri]|nr:hypothetical protein LEP1GSC166_0421 [Leptospira kirschneri]